MPLLPPSNQQLYLQIFTTKFNSNNCEPLLRFLVFSDFFFLEKLRHAVGSQKVKWHILNICHIKWPNLTLSWNVQQIKNTYSSPLVKPHQAGTESRRYRHVIFFQTYAKIFKIQIFPCHIWIQLENECWPGVPEITLQFWDISNIWTSTGHFSVKLLQKVSKFEFFLLP